MTSLSWTTGERLSVVNFSRIAGTEYPLDGFVAAEPTLAPHPKMKLITTIPVVAVRESHREALIEGGRTEEVLEVSARMSTVVVNLAWRP